MPSPPPSTRSSTDVGGAQTRAAQTWAMEICYTNDSNNNNNI